MPVDLWYRYEYMHVSTGSRFVGVTQFESQCEFLRQLNEWNVAAPMSWHYWATDTLGKVTEEMWRTA